jgi:DNA-binding transcriptional LysR family regulator
MMDFQTLGAFVAVADAGSFSLAAERLHLSQPAVSKRIATLEAGLDHPLFDRVGRRVHLTEAGLALLPYARRALEDLEDARRALTHLQDATQGRLSIGTSHHIGLHRLPSVLRRFTRQYPGVDLDLSFMDSEQACDAVAAGDLELGIVTLPLNPEPRLHCELVWPDPLAVVVGVDHPLAARTTVPLQSLADHPAVLPDRQTYTHRIVREALEAHGLTPHVRLATNYLETLKMLAAINLGWSVLPASMVDDSLRVLALPELHLTRSLGLVWHRRRVRSQAADALIALLRESRTSAAPA